MTEKNDGIAGRPQPPVIWLVLSIAAALAGVAFFLLLFVPDFNIYTLIIAPIIIAFYEAPAVFLFWIYKKKKEALDNPAEEVQESGDRAEDTPEN
jgi:hypothetical protein